MDFENIPQVAIDARGGTSMLLSRFLTKKGTKSSWLGLTSVVLCIVIFLRLSE